MCEQSGAGVYQNSRQRLIWGEVHDGNAYFSAAGHAGLFSSASDTFRLAQQFLAESTTDADAENVFAVSHQHDTGTRGVALARVATRGNE